MKIRNMTSLALIDGEKILMLYKEKSRIFSKPIWVAGAGGHFEESEMCESDLCLFREAEEEIGLSREDLHDVRLKYVSCALFAGEFYYNYFYFAELVAQVDKAALQSNEGMLKWVNFDDITHLTMPDETAQCILHYISTGRFDDSVYFLAGGFYDGGFKSGIVRMD